MARLILINRAPASGKSTLARRYAQDHPLTLALDIDAIRGMLGSWLDQPAEAGQLARDMALEMARVQLRAGHDVVVPQFAGRLEFVRALAQLCDGVGARFVEVVLRADPQDLVQRFTRRSAQPETAEHRDAQALLERNGGTGALPEMHERLMHVVASRPDTRTVATVEGRVEQSYRDFLAELTL